MIILGDSVVSKYATDRLSPPSVGSIFDATPIESPCPKCISFQEVMHYRSDRRAAIATRLHNLVYSSSRLMSAQCTMGWTEYTHAH